MTAFDEASPPAPFDTARAERTFASLAAEGFMPSEGQRAILAGAFGNSPFLARLALREHAMLERLLREGPLVIVDEAKEQALCAARAETQPEAMARLRIAKRRAALAIALADIAGIWRLEDVTRALSEFADAAVKGTLRFVLRHASEKAELPERDGAQLEATTCLTVLAIGKYGRFDFKYSSNIDSVVCYDPTRI